ncbi:unnamed protein product [Tetraodon nigroviridis]|uniref:(spotted green pufferfish) hypothetical protein n=1 Tax=Tetraodon nigroviridis TaxID=99883 RepID=Q4RWU5_TETNG|nr:unnamed protein product [Tetraodon nigroviridis]
MAAKLRNGPQVPICLHGLYQSQKTVTHLISHNQELQLDPCDHSSGETFLPKLTMAAMMVKVEFSLAGYTVCGGFPVPSELLLCQIMNTVAI